MKYYSCRVARVSGIEVLVARTGYTGEDGFEIFCDAGEATHIWDALLAQGRPAGLEPAGLGARDVLRLEAGMPLYGHEMTEDITPLQAGLGWALKLSKPDFIGRAALEAQFNSGGFHRIAGLLLDGKSQLVAVTQCFWTICRRAKSAADRLLLRLEIETSRPRLLRRRQLCRVPGLRLKFEVVAISQRWFQCRSTDAQSNATAVGESTSKLAATFAVATMSC